MKFEYWKSSSDNKWYWHLKASNGEKIAQGEGYTTKEDCLYGISLVKSSGKADEVNLTPDGPGRVSPSTERGGGKAGDQMSGPGGGR